MGMLGPGRQYGLLSTRFTDQRSDRNFPNTLEGSSMKLRTLAAVAAISVSIFAGQALADGRIAVALDAPVAAKTKVVAGGAVFVCEGAECVSAQAPSRALTAVACKALAKEVGRVSAFGGETKSLDADDLTRCNAAAKGAATLAAT
jgi:hypothetical protein